MELERNRYPKHPLNLRPKRIHIILDRVSRSINQTPLGLIPPLWSIKTPRILKVIENMSQSRDKPSREWPLAKLQSSRITAPRMTTSLTESSDLGKVC